MFGWINKLLGDFPIYFGRGCEFKRECEYYNPEQWRCRDGCVGMDFHAHCGKYRELAELR